MARLEGDLADIEALKDIKKDLKKRKDVRINSIFRENFKTFY